MNVLVNRDRLLECGLLYCCITWHVTNIYGSCCRQYGDDTVYTCRSTEILAKVSRSGDMTDIDLDLENNSLILMAFQRKHNSNSG